MLVRYNHTKIQYLTYTNYSIYIVFAIFCLKNSIPSSQLSNRLTIDRSDSLFLVVSHSMWSGWVLVPFPKLTKDNGCRRNQWMSWWNLLFPLDCFWHCLYWRATGYIASNWVCGPVGAPQEDSTCVWHSSSHYFVHFQPIIVRTLCIVEATSNLK